MGSQRPAGTFSPLPICASYCHTVQQGGRGSGQFCPGGYLNWRGAWGGNHSSTPSTPAGPSSGEVDPSGRGKREDWPCWGPWCGRDPTAVASLCDPTGVSSSPKLLFSVCCGVSPAVQPHPQASDSLGGSSQVGRMGHWAGLRARRGC